MAYEGSPSVPGTLLARKVHDPGTLAVWTTSSATLAAVDTTNARIVFTPTTAAVKMVVSFWFADPAATSVLALGFLEGATAKINRWVKGTVVTTPSGQMTWEVVVAGLTPGTPLTWDLAFRRASGSGSPGILAGGPDGGTAVSPLIIEAIAA